MLYNWFVNRHSAKIILTYRHLIKHSMSYSSAPWSSDHFLLFLIWTIWDKIIWDTESKLPTIRYHVSLWEKVPRVNFKLPDLLPVYPQEIVVPVEHFVSKFPVVFWKIFTCKPDVKAAVKDLQITGDYVTAVQIIEDEYLDRKVNCFVITVGDLVPSQVWDRSPPGLQLLGLSVPNWFKPFSSGFDLV